MKLPFITCLLLAGCSAAPSGNDSNIIINDDFFDKNYVIYTGQHDIVRIFIPFDQFNFDGGCVDLSRGPSSSSSEQIEHRYTLFFIEGDIFDETKVVNQGLHIFKNGKVTRLLDNARDITATQTRTIYFGADDGIYKYDNVNNKATKHGKVNHSIIQLAYNNKTNSIYYLTDGYEVYKLNEDATDSVKVSGLKDVNEMVFGYEGYLYYFNSDKVFYVVDIEAGGEPKEIKGLPANKQTIILVSGLYGLEEGVFCYIDEWVYSLDGEKAEKSPIKIEAPITAAAPQPILFQFYSKDKKIYEFNIIQIISSDLFDGFRATLEQYEEKIASEQKSTFRFN